VTLPRANHRHQALSRAVPRNQATTGTGERSLARDRVVWENWVGRGRPSVLYAVIAALKLTMFPSEPRDLLPAAYPFVARGSWRSGCRLMELVAFTAEVRVSDQVRRVVEKASSSALCVIGRIAHGGGSGLTGVRGMLDNPPDSNSRKGIRCRYRRM
jgi:hypothetical protein